MVYHVAYDLNVPGQHYDRVIAEITRTANIQILKSSWLVETNESPVVLHNRIRAVADANDRLFISEVTGNNFGSLSPDAWNWLDARVPRTASPANIGVQTGGLVRRLSNGRRVQIFNF